ncbi:hypothetical protein [Meiothermus cerbereus]|uniref:hypothetical protein n=1 Tax=Meiothermus cerbereus TaxID=65552 RepID=UPI0004863647|nr:hypothetical protein [Meiothermus cerbereus]
MEFKKVSSGYMVRSEGKVLTRANPGWGGAVGTLRGPDGVEWRYFPTLDEALLDPDFGSLVEAGEAWWREVEA